METWFKRFKYGVLVPVLAFFTGWLNKADKNLLAKQSEGSLFVLGSGRNGSTLMALLLNRHPEVFLPPEQFSLPYTIVSYKVGGSINLKKFATQAIRYYRSKNQNWVLSSERFNEVEKDVLDDVEHRSNPVYIYNKVMRSYADEAGVSSPKWIGDHSPLTTVFGRLVLPYFPSGKMLFLMRHPLDVVQSYQSIPSNPASNYKYAAWKWNNSVEVYEKLANQDNVMLVKYEDLVSEPQRIMESVFSFLEVPVLNVVDSPNTEGESDPMGAKEMSNHQNLYKPITTSSINSWKSKMSDEVYRGASPLIAKNAAKFGYDLKR